MRVNPIYELRNKRLGQFAYDSRRLTNFVNGIGRSPPELTNVNVLKPTQRLHQNGIFCSYEWRTMGLS